jgi:hypothetical protein
MKSLKDHLKESEAPTNVTGTSVAMPDKVLGKPVYKIPHAAYVNMMQGKQRGKRWKEILDDVDLTTELKKKLYSKKEALLQCEEYPEKMIALKMK